MNTAIQAHAPLIALIITFPTLGLAANQLTVKATNKLQTAQTSQTLELAAGDLLELGETNLAGIHVQDGSGK